jgi:hypothetical protein
MLFLFSLLNDIQYESKHSSYAKDFLVSRATIIKDVQEDILNNNITNVMQVSAGEGKVNLNFFRDDTSLMSIEVESKKITYKNALGEVESFSLSEDNDEEVFDFANIKVTPYEGPISDEFKKIYMDMTYGLSIEVVFDRFYNRVKLDDAKYIASSLTLLNKTGGNIVKVFGTIEKSFFSKKKLKQEMQSLTSASIFVYRTLCVMPFLFILAIYILNPTYFTPMFETTLGSILLFVTVLFYSLYIFIIKRVMEVKM